MLREIAEVVLAAAPIVGLLLWRDRVDARQKAAWLVRADIHAAATRALDGESLLAIDVDPPRVWRRGRVRFSTPSGYESLIGRALHAVDDRVPVNYDVVIYCGSGS
jgi:hypothetical protein